MDMKFNKLASKVMCLKSGSAASRRQLAESIFVVSKMDAMLEAEYFFANPHKCSDKTIIFVDVVSPLSFDQCSIIENALSKGVSFIFSLENSQELENLSFDTKNKAQDFTVDLSLIVGQKFDAVELVLFS